MYRSGECRRWQTSSPPRAGQRRQMHAQLGQRSYRLVSTEDCRLRSLTARGWLHARPDPDPGALNASRLDRDTADCDRCHLG